MKQLFNHIICFIYIVTITPALLANINVSPYIRIRSQGEPTARTLQGMTSFLTRSCTDSTQLFFAMSTGYNKSNKPGRLAENLFGNMVRCTKWDVAALSIAGSGVAGRNNSTELLADYFGLPRDFRSALLMIPRVDSALVEGDLQLFLNSITPGLWTRIRMPYVFTRWNLNLKECISDAGSANYQPGYFNGTVVLGTENPTGTYADAYGVARADLLNNFIDFVAHQKTPHLGNDVTFVPLRYARCSDKRLTKSALADIYVDLGYRLYQRDNFHCDLGLAVVIPTGNRPEGVYAFEPMIGNNHHWEVGGIVQAHWRCAQSPDLSTYCDVWLDARITHMWSTHQHRTFDLKGKPNSRYMLAMTLNNGSQDLFTNELPGDVAGSIAAPAQYGGILSPVANLTTIPAQVSVSFQANMLLMLSYTKQPYTWEIGYNLWAHGAESITIKATDACALNHHQWALKGDAQLYGFGTDVTPPSIDTIALSPSQSCATVTSGTNNVVSLNTNQGGINGLRPTQNPGVDNPAYARRTETASGLNQNINDRPDNLGLQIETSAQPVYITIDDFDVVGAQTKGLSSGFYAGFCRTWHHHPSGYTPFIAAGAQAEVHSFDPYCGVPGAHACSINVRPQDESSSRVCGISQWSAWVKGGFYY